MKILIPLFGIATLVSLPLEAAPALRADAFFAAEVSAVENIADSGFEQPEYYRTGSSEWWRAMDHAGRGGFE